MSEIEAEVEVTPRLVLRNLEALRRAAMEGGAYAPALRAVELQGRFIDMWKSEAASGPTLEELVKASFAPEKEGEGGG